MLLSRAALTAVLFCSLPLVAQPAPRSVSPLDEGWSFYPMPDFKLWPAQPQLTTAQIKQLECPAPGRGWQAVHLPDDYVVHGEFSPEPNASMLAGGAVCGLGGRQCEIP